MPTMLRTPIVLGLAVALAACARAANPATDEEPTPSGETAVNVENQSYLDMNIYLIRSGARNRLGTVPGLSSRLFRIPPALVGGGADLQFLADPIGSNRTPISERMWVKPGDLVELVIPAQP